VKLYPNPARESVNVRIEDMTMKADFIRIVNLTGKVVYEDKLDPEIRDFQIPVDFRPGIYILQMGSGELTFFAQKLVVTI
jgi:Secretion system C-terminal sorting domain